MNPVLFDKNETVFLGQGIGTMDCVSCLVTEERNGIYELVAKVRKESRHFDDIVEGNIIAATHSNRQDRQPFQIYKVTRTIDGYAEVRAEHISYRLNRNTVMPFTADSATAAIAGLKQNAVEDCPFYFFTNVDTEGTFKVTKPENFKAMLTGSSGSMTDVYKGGEFEYDQFYIKYLKDRGQDKGVSIRYGKNLTDLSKETDISEIYTSIVPYWSGVDEDQNDVLVTVPENVVDSSYVNLFSSKRTVPVDLSGKFEDMPTVEALRAAARQYIDDNVRRQLLTTIKAKFVDLTITDEYKGMFEREGVDLCDTVTVSYPEIGVTDKAKVTRVVYNVLLDRYDSIELGDLKKTLGDIFGRRPAITRESAKQMVKKEKEAREEVVQELREMIENIEPFPVGSVYLSMTDTNPSVHFGGTWQQISQGMYLKGVSSGTAGETGGDTGGHTHEYNIETYQGTSFAINAQGGSDVRTPIDEIYPKTLKEKTTDYDSLMPMLSVDLTSLPASTNAQARITTLTGETEGATAEPPYFTVYVWKRVA